MLRRENKHSSEVEGGSDLAWREELEGKWGQEQVLYETGEKYRRPGE